MSLERRLPFPGLRAFTREESDLFFGREGCVDAMVDRLAATRFLAVLGPSGSGKSSLVRTGLLSALQMGLQPGTGTRWKIAEMHPGGQPIRELATALLQATRVPVAQIDASQGLLPEAADVDVLTTFLRKGPRSLREWMSHGNVADGAYLLVLVDQFEELFRYSDYAQREEADAFAGLLLESTSDRRSAIQVVITMRSEYLGACSSITGLAERVSAGMYLTPRMDREQCQQAIEGPASVLDFTIEPALVNRLLNDLETFSASTGEAQELDSLLSHQADQLPLMQHVLNRLWLAAQTEAPQDDVVLRAADYERIGGLAGALDEHGAQIMADLGESNGPVVETVFRALVSGTSIATAVRRPCRMHELIGLVEASGHSQDDVLRVVEAFHSPSCNFLRTSALSGSRQDVIVDISHESLIRQWAPLRQWLDKEIRDGLAWRRLASAEEHHRLGEGGLLTGVDLNNLTAWWESTRPTAAWALRHGGRFVETEAFLAASRQAEADRVNIEKEQQRAQRRRFLSYITALSVALVIVVVLGIQVYRDGKKALQARNEAVQARNDAVQAKNEAVRKRRQAEVAEGRATEEAKRTVDILNGISNLVHSDHYRELIGVTELQSDVMRELQVYQTEMSRVHAAMVGKGSIVRDDYRRGVSFEAMGNAQAALREFKKGYEDGREAVLVTGLQPDEDLEGDFLDDGYRYAWFLLDIGHDATAAQVIQDMEKLAGTLDTRGKSARLLVAHGRLENLERRYYQERREYDLAKRHSARALDFGQRALTLPHPDLNTLFFGFRSYANRAWDVADPEKGQLRTQACALADRLITMSSMDSRSISARAECLSQKADDASDKSDLKTAGTELLQAVDLVEGALRTAPRDQGLLLRLADLEDSLGTVAQKQNNLDDQARHRIAAKNLIVAALNGRTVFPSDAINLKAIYDNCRFWLDEDTNPLNRYEKVAFYNDIAESLSATLLVFPAVPMLASIEADASSHLAELLEKETGGARKAEAYLTHAIQVFDESGLLQKVAPFSENFAAYCYAYEQRARLYASLKRTGLMIADITKMRQQCQPLLDKYPWDFWLRVKFIDSDALAGKTLFNLGRYRAAQSYLENASKWGVKESSLLLARMYREGLEVPHAPQRALELQRLAGKQSMKRFTVPAKLHNSENTTTLYFYIEDWPVDYPSTVVEDQVRWAKEARELTVEPKVVESFGKLYKIARENKLSFSKLVAAALSDDNEKGEAGKALYDARINFLSATDAVGLEGLRDAAEKRHSELVGSAQNKKDADALDSELAGDAEQLLSESDTPNTYRVAWQINVDRAKHIKASANTVAEREEERQALNRSLELAEHLPSDNIDDLGRRMQSFGLLGTLAVESGDHASARTWYTKERDVAYQRFLREVTSGHFSSLRVASLHLYDELVFAKQKDQADTLQGSLVDAAETLLAHDSSDDALDEGSLVYWKVASQAASAGDGERTLQGLRHSQKLAERIQGDTPDSLYSRYVILDSIGGLYRKEKAFPDARDAYRQSATSLERYVQLATASPPHRAQLDDDSLAVLFGNLSWMESKSGNFPKAIEAALQGMKLDSSPAYIEANLALGLLFSGKPKEAMSHYMNVRASKQNEQPMSVAVREDFATMKELGFEYAGEEEILRKMAGP